MRSYALRVRTLFVAGILSGFLAATSRSSAEEAAVIIDQQPSTNALAEQFAETTDREEEAKLKEQLIAAGERAIHDIGRQAKNHENARVRLRCYELLSQEFDEFQAIHNRIARSGLRDQSEDVRYHCAFAVGSLKIYAGHWQLRRLMNDSKQPDYVRHAAAKSLAELAEPDVIKQLVEMMQNDRFMARHMGNLGAKALTGRNLEDFNDYKYGEGAFVSGGVERISEVAPEHYHNLVAKRHQAIADYCAWLAKERPEIYKHIGVSW